MNAREIADFLRTRRAKSGCAQKDMAERVGVGLRNFRDYEYGESKPRLDTFLAWCEELGVRIELRA